MTCPYHDTLSASIDNAMSPGEAGQLADHLARCPVCREHRKRLLALRQDLQDLPSPTLGFDLAARLEERLRPPPKRPPRPFWTIWLPGGVSSAVALATGVWLGSLLIGGSVPSPMMTMRAFDPVPPGGLCAAPEICSTPKGLP